MALCELADLAGVLHDASPAHPCCYYSSVKNDSETVGTKLVAIVVMESVHSKTLFRIASLEIILS